NSRVTHGAERWAGREARACEWQCLECIADVREKPFRFFYISIETIDKIDGSGPGGGRRSSGKACATRIGGVNGMTDGDLRATIAPPNLQRFWRATSMPARPRQPSAHVHATRSPDFPDRKAVVGL